MTRICLFWWLCIATLLTLHSARAQKHSPKVGLVLSGGGAKGMAHIGILRAIDSAGLKIDYVTGTSMGSIMGGMYAIGYSGAQIDSIGKTLDWDVLLSNKPSFQDISLDEKDEYQKYAVEVGIKDMKPQIGTGLIESEEMWLKLGEVFFPVYDIKDFSKFNIPFKCIATDLATGKAVVHEQGEITKALRSSMAIPSVFSAIEFDSTKLVDGGIVRNFPVTDIKKMGADIVIGVNLFSGLTKTEDLKSALDIMYQITNYRDAEDLIKEKQLCNLIIEPPVGAYSAGSFSETDTIQYIGIQMGRLYYPYFKKLADSLNAIHPITYDPYNRLPEKDSVRIESYEITGLEKTSKTMLVHNLNIRLGKSYNAFQINDGFRKAYSTRYYSKVFYTLTPTDSNTAKLNCLLKENPLTSLKLGLSFHSYTDAAILVTLAKRNMLFDKSRTMLKLALGENFRGLAQHKQALGKQLNHFLTFGISYEALPYPVYDKTYPKSQRFLYRAYITTSDLNYKRLFNTNKTIGVGISNFNFNLNPDITANGAYEGNFNSFYTYINLEINTLDRRFFPRSGVEINVEAGLYFSRTFDLNVNYNDTVVDANQQLSTAPVERIKFNYLHLTPVSKRISYIQNIGIGIQKTNNQSLPVDMFILGGIQPIIRNQFVFSGLKEGQIQSGSFAGITMGVQYRMINELYLTPKISGAFYDFTTISKWVDPYYGKGILGGSLTLGYNLSVMPMEFTIMYSPRVNVIYGHVKLGFLF